MLKQNQAKENAKKLKIRVNRSCQAIIQQETKYKQEKPKDKNTPNPEKEYFIPNIVANSIPSKISIWLGVNHKRRK